MLLRGFISILFICPSLALAAQDSPQSFSLDGRLYETGSSNPLLDTGTLVIQVLNPGQDCVLYEETQTFNTLSTDGSFSIHIGSETSSGKRGSADRNNALTRVFSNTGATPIDGKLASDGTTDCTYAATPGAVRRLRVKVITSDSAVHVLSPDTYL